MFEGDVLADTDVAEEMKAAASGHVTKRVDDVLDVCVVRRHSVPVPPPPPKKKKLRRNLC